MHEYTTIFVQDVAKHRIGAFVGEEACLDRYWPRAPQRIRASSFQATP